MHGAPYKERTQRLGHARTILKRIALRPATQAAGHHVVGRRGKKEWRPSSGDLGNPVRGSGGRSCPSPCGQLHRRGLPEGAVEGKSVCMFVFVFFVYANTSSHAHMRGRPARGPWGACPGALHPSQKLSCHIPTTTIPTAESPLPEGPVTQGHLRRCDQVEGVPDNGLCKTADPAPAHAEHRLPWHGHSYLCNFHPLVSAQAGRAAFDGQAAKASHTSPLFFHLHFF